MEMVQARVIGLVVGLSLMTACCADSGRLTGNPLAHLPDNIELLTRFGERSTRLVAALAAFVLLLGGCVGRPAPPANPPMCHAPGGGYVPCNFGYHGTGGP